MDAFAKETLPISLEEEMRRSYLDYAMSVIVGRALPDVRDGLKPVHRRVLYAMHELNNDWNRAYKKSARIVGDVIGKYHPHGDQAVYDTIVRMAQDFSLRYMLVDGQGNFGSVDGDPPAAMRYTEIRLAKVAHEMLVDIDQETVDFVPNYDGSEHEPALLPAKLPNLLVNGSSGIAVGMATNIPPHNLAEVVEGCLFCLRNPACSIDELIELIPAPDFPTGAIIYGIAGVREGYRTGRGRVLMRAKAHFEDMDKSGARQQIVVTELPYQVNKKTLQERIGEFFTRLFPIAYHYAINPHQDRQDFTEKFKSCLYERIDDIQPFGDTPQDIFKKIGKSLEATRILVQSLTLGKTVLDRTDNVLFTTDSGSSPQQEACYDALLRMTYCPKCKGIGKAVSPCSGFCTNVVR